MEFFDSFPVWFWMIVIAFTVGVLGYRFAKDGAKIKVGPVEIDATEEEVKKEEIKKEEVKK